MPTRAQPANGENPSGRTRRGCRGRSTGGCCSSDSGCRWTARRRAGRECRCGLLGDEYGHHSVQCSTGTVVQERHNHPVRVLSVMAKRVECVAYVEKPMYGRVSRPPKGVEHTYTADIAIAG